MKDIVLFDMDGTLTEARKEIKDEVVSKLKVLSQYAQIGVVTGSGMDYVMQQLQKMWYDIGSIDPEKIILMPCNGTMVYEWQKNQWKETFAVSIRDYLREEKFFKLFKVLISFQNKIIQESGNSLPLTGHFISFRDSLVNLCPPGRNASDADRKNFITYDRKFKLREKYLPKLKDELRVHGLTNLSVTLGGNTSFDIYPIGWDKTFSLKHFSGYRQWFVGDRCDDDGNDRKIYELLAQENRSFKTTGPEKTIKIIDSLVKILNNEV